MKSFKELFEESGYTPNEEMVKAAEKGLELRKEHDRGGTDVGVSRARDIKNKKSLSANTVKRMKAYFDRHASDKEGKGWNEGEEGYPSAGRIAWLLWGGDAGKKWAKDICDKDELNESVMNNRGVQDLHKDIVNAIIKHVKRGKVTPAEVGKYWEEANKGMRMTLSFRPNAEDFIENLMVENTEFLEEKTVSKKEFTNLIDKGWKEVSNENDIPDERGVKWVWSKELKKFAYYLPG